MGVDCLVTRSGYTGEDGFEISMPAGEARAIVDRLLEFEEMLPIGLGARDTLRLEAGLCLYGKDIDLTTSPVAAGLEWSIPKCRRSEGVRAGGFPGAADDSGTNADRGDTAARGSETGQPADPRLGKNL